MSLEALQKSLRTLPFKDMVEFAKSLREFLIAADPHGLQHLHQVTPYELADALQLAAKIGNTYLSEETGAERTCLLKLFVRKRQVNIKTFNTGFVVDIPSLKGSTVSSRDLREGLQQCLDQVVTIKALHGAKYGE